MKRKLQFLTKTLLVAAGLLVGASSAWGAIDLDDPSTYTEKSYDLTTGTLGKSSTVYATVSKINYYVATSPDAWVGNIALQDASNGSGNGLWIRTGGLQAYGGGRSIILCGLKSGQKIVMTGSASDFTFTAVNSSTFTGGTATGSTAPYTYTVDMTNNGDLMITISKNSYLKTLKVYTEKIAGVCEDPTYNITGANGNARTFTLACATDESSIYYSTSELATATGGTLYSAAVETEATTIWAYAKTASATSSVISFSTGAGSTLTLSTPAISASGFTNTDGASVNNPTFNFTCDNSAIIGKPAATLTYTFTPAGGVESAATAGTSYTPTGYGTLKVIASASGYNSSEKSLLVSNFYTVFYTGRDYTTATTSEITSATWGVAYTPTWEGWASGLTAYTASTAISEDAHLNVQNAGTISLVTGWGLVRGDQKTYGYRVRYANEGEFVAFKENSSKASDADATTYQTEYCASGTGLVTDLVTITAPAAYAVQQLFHYTPSPASESVTVTAAGYATYVSAYNLDFTSTSIKAYEAKVNAGKVVLTPINKVQAGTGVVLYKEGGATESIPVCTDYDTASNNELVAGTGAAVATDGTTYTNYILNNVDGIGFYKANGQTVASNRAYLHTLTANISGGAPLYMFFNDSETTGINAVKGAEFKVNGEYYDLQGHRVAQPTKGLYIVNGRKVVIK